MTRTKKFVSLRLLFAAVIPLSILFTSCGSEDKTNEEQATQSEEAVVVEDDVWVVEEYEINDLPITSQSPITAEKPITKKAPAKDENQPKASSTKAVAADTQDEEYDIATLDYLSAMATEKDYLAETTIDVKEMVIPLEETQTLVSFSKKGKAETAFQVVSNESTGEIEQIIFTDKKHTDIYDVTTGMSASDVKKLRKDLKRMEHKGKVYLYNDDSNVMYLMDAENMAGKEITEADIENMNVSAIIWKDKKHHKKNK